jgi:molecular chaperone DnaK
MHEPGPIIGIDLGTTNSVVAVIEGNQPRVIVNAEGQTKTPSIIALMEDGQVVVGEMARRQATTQPERTISSVKRLIGRLASEVEEEARQFPFELGRNADGYVTIRVGDREWLPAELSAEILRKLKADAEAHLGEPVTRAIVTVPAYFDDLQRQATLEAARLAGLDVLRLLNEPTAAAMAYGLGRHGQHTVAVYDFGGGTFDFSVLDIDDKTFEVMATTGDSRLGGDDLDGALMDWLANRFEEQGGVNLRDDSLTRRRLKDAAEQAKCELSTTFQTLVSLPFIAYQDGNPLHLEICVTRETFEELAEPLVQESLECCRRCLREARLKVGDIHKVILVGGSTRIPLVQEMVEEFFGIAPFKGLNPDEIVAAGAAAQGGVMNGELEDVVLLDVTPHALGIEVRGGRMSGIIEKNSTIPIRVQKLFTTTEDDQSFVNIHVLQGDAEEAANCRSLGRFTLSGILQAQAGRARIRVTFFINADGILEISATDLQSGAEKTLTIEHAYLPAEERREAQQGTAARRRRRRRRPAGDGAGGSASAQARLPQGTEAGAASKSGTGERPAVGVEAGASAPSREAPVTKAGQERPANAGQRLASTRSPQASLEVVATTDSPTPAKAGGFAEIVDGEDNAARIAATPIPSLQKPAPMLASASASASEAGPVEASAKEPVANLDEELDVEPVEALAAAPVANLGEEPVEALAEASTEAPFQAPPEAADTQQGVPKRSYRPISKTQEPMPSLAEVTSHLVATSPMELRDLIALLSEGRGDGDAGDRYDALRRPFLAYCQANAEDMALQLLLARFHILTNQAEEARDVLEALRMRRPELAERLMDVYGELCRNYPQYLAARKDRASLATAIGDYQTAMIDLEFVSQREEHNDKILERLRNVYEMALVDRPDATTQFKLVKLHLRQQDLDAAIGLLQQLVMQAEHRDRANKILGLCFWQKGMRHLAWQKFRNLSLDDEMKDMLYRLAEDMERHDELQHAKQCLERIYEDDIAYREIGERLKKLSFRLELQQDERYGGLDAGLGGKDGKGMELLGRFEVLQEINRGSMGIVYKARDTILEEIVAIKVLNDFLCSDPQAVERFKQEARSARRLTHHNIVRIHDMFEHDKKKIISMEFIEGDNLKDLLRRNVTFSEDTILGYLVQICEGLAYAHRLGVVHRDIKPANIMLTDRNVLKITDFGIAKLLTDHRNKATTMIMGTPLYMAPEQIEGGNVNHRCDIYSLGVMLYEMIAGHPPFHEGNIEYQHVHNPPPEIARPVSKRLRQTIFKCLEKDPDSRFQTVEEILARAI